MITYIVIQQLTSNSNVCGVGQIGGGGGVWLGAYSPLYMYVASGMEKVEIVINTTHNTIYSK